MSVRESPYSSMQHDLVTNSADYMEYWNTDRIRSSQAALFSQAEIDAYRNATDRERYPNFNWIDYMVNDAHAQSHYLSANGGTEKTSYNLAFGYLTQDGIVGWTRIQALQF